MKATDRFIRTLLSKVNLIRETAGLPKADLLVFQYKSGTQHRHSYALKNNTTLQTPMIPGNTMVYYLQGILLGYELSQKGAQ